MALELFAVNAVAIADVEVQFCFIVVRWFYIKLYFCVCVRACVIAGWVFSLRLLCSL